MAVTAWAAGERVTADRLNQMLPRYSSWTPTWSTSTGSNTPSFGNATLDCEYTQTGDLVVARFEIVFGSTTNFGAAPTTNDNWRFTLPVTASTTLTAIGWAEINQSTSKRHVCRIRATTTTDFELELSSGAPDGADTTAGGAVGGGKGIIDSLTPWSAAAGTTTWASGYSIRGNLSYKAA